ncbi:iron export ABC transporter permease subunit FetB [Acidithiobacillus sp.]|jgi:putative ABC transport system permease protein|uniref:ABC transporter permease n=1 Tax=Acidithiobacillus sp. TaxID=1872118 RepID=UPI0025C4B805|nr:iron export ABC transporter permease subunit FetB [Acidithiobacillus sp.]MCK9188177.1 iron export ABC transporter permease subunit FetB [Acidithiobacillus sp.]MCK9360299.1 iron export ABC transporter permease subunit FetB [Acidithiobacillus sp.]
MNNAAPDIFSTFSPWTMAGVMGLLGSAWALSAWQRLEVGKELLWSAARAMVQLGIMGILLGWLFRQHQPFLLVFFLAAMILMAGRFNRKRGAGIPHAYWIGVISIGVATTVTLGWMLLSGLAFWRGESLVPIGGMIIGNAMNAVSLALNRLRSEVDQREALLLAMLALGANHRQAMRNLYSMVVRSALIPTIDSLKSVGMIHIPGITAGMILAGMAPLAAVSMQLVVMVMLTASVTLSVSTAVLLAAPRALVFSQRIEG